MSRAKPQSVTRNDSFICGNCGLAVSAELPGSSFRNHCPNCLYSLHVDRTPGDRLSLCKGLMKPISLWKKDNDEICLIHYCTRCGMIKTNRLAGDDDDETVHKILAEIQTALENNA
jgi:hypothetical protein